MRGCLLVTMTLVIGAVLPAQRREAFEPPQRGQQTERALPGPERPEQLRERIQRLEERIRQVRERLGARDDGGRAQRGGRQRAGRPDGGGRRLAPGRLDGQLRPGLRGPRLRGPGHGSDLRARGRGLLRLRPGLRRLLRRALQQQRGSGDRGPEPAPAPAPGRRHRKIVA
jgi:hypothetical protein